MKAFTGSGPVSKHPWLVSTLAGLFLAACATTQENPREPEDVDIGYGTVDRDHVVGSVSKIDAEDLPEVNSRSLADMLARLPGVQVREQPGGGLSVRIRASSSFLGGQDPLFVVDGMVFNGPLNGLNPRNIESITVLKDAGATAIYGSRGANGVILIKTKQGSG